jgi:putative phosphoesterase
MIGIMADSHDNLPAIKKAIRLFKDAGCKLVIHAGDFIAPFAARELEALHCPVKAVFGNCDGEKKGLEKALASFGKVQKEPFIFSHEGRKYYLTHVPADLKRHAASGLYDVIIFAHTHSPEIQKKGRTLIVNPGETGGWVSGKSTVALVDSDTLSAEILPL